MPHVYRYLQEHASHTLALDCRSGHWMWSAEQEQQLGATFRRFDATQEHHVHCNEKRITLLASTYDRTNSSRYTHAVYRCTTRTHPHTRASQDHNNQLYKTWRKPRCVSWAFQIILRTMATHVEWRDTQCCSAQHLSSPGRLPIATTAAAKSSRHTLSTPDA
eukprot:2764171-Amphidinium_carterae.6